MATPLVRKHCSAKCALQNADVQYYRTAIDKYLLPGIGAHRLERLESEHIERLYAKLRKDGAKSSTLLQVHRTIRAALNEAERRDRIARNPIRVVRSPRSEETEIEPLTVEDAHAILREAGTRRNGVGGLSLSRSASDRAKHSA
jgi:integrase